MAVSMTSPPRCLHRLSVWRGERWGGRGVGCGRQRTLLSSFQGFARRSTTSHSMPPEGPEYPEYEGVRGEERGWGHVR
eukprot:749755-Hanusia_phi.AAC.2